MRPAAKTTVVVILSTLTMPVGSLPFAHNAKHYACLFAGAQEGSSSSITHVSHSATVPTDYVTKLCHMILGGYMGLHFSLPVLSVSLTDL